VLLQINIALGLSPIADNSIRMVFIHFVISFFQLCLKFRSVTRKYVLYLAAPFFNAKNSLELLAKKTKACAENLI